LRVIPSYFDHCETLVKLEYYHPPVKDDERIDSPSTLVDLNSHVKVLCNSANNPKWFYVNPAQTSQKPGASWKKVIFTDSVPVQSGIEWNLSKVQYRDSGYYYCYGQYQNYGDNFFAKFELKVYGNAIIININITILGYTPCYVLYPF